MSTYQTDVPQVTITETGIAIPETHEILAGTLKDIGVAFGADLNLSSVSTPQYVLASEQAQAIALAYAAMAFALSQFDPATAIGRFQDALARIYFITRKPGTPTVVTATCTGVPGSVLPAGSRARDVQGNIYTSLSEVIFDVYGQAKVQFANIENGALPCAAGTLIHIQQAVSGWDAITNENPGVTGTDIEGRDEMERRRWESVALNAIGTVPAIRAAVLDIRDVTDCYVIENKTGETVTVGTTSYPLKSHSVYVGVTGGDDEEIARTIWRKKDLGCDMNGNTTVTILDSTALKMPYPEYEIVFNRPDPVNIKFLITIQRDVALPSDIELRIKNAVMDAFNGNRAGFDRERMAAIIYASSYYTIVATVTTRINIISLLIGTETADSSIVTTGIDQVPVIQSEDITVVMQ